MNDRRRLLQGTALAAAVLALPRAARTVTAPVRSRPTAQQLAWQREELAMFVHFTVNTFTEREWGDGSEDPRLFDPRRLDARQWAGAARQAGFRSMILTAKHHDGFCLWPTRTTEHSVRASPWRGGKGDLVREFVDACRAEGLKPGLYLSPWDRNHPSYGTPRYNDVYVAQLTELLGNYGPLAEQWFDGANGEGTNGRRQVYDWDRFHRTVRRLQPQAVIMSDAGPDVRWIGNERGVAGATCWSTIDPARVPYAGFTGLHVEDDLGRGDPRGLAWRPGECDVSIRPGWFWHASESGRVRSVDDLMELYFLSVGRNAKLLLNVPPNQDGLFEDVDVERLLRFATRRQALFATNLAASGRIVAEAGRDAQHVLDGDPNTFWRAPGDARSGALTLELPAPVRFDTVLLQEAIAFGQGIAAYRVEAWCNGAWATLVRGTTIGCKKLDRIVPVETGRVRVVIEQAFDSPKLAGFGLYRSAVPARKKKIERYDYTSP